MDDGGSREHRGPSRALRRRRRAEGGGGSGGYSLDDRTSRVAKSVAVRDDRADLSPRAVNARLRAFIISHREAEARGEHRPFAESDALLAAMAEEALAKQAEAQVAEAELELRTLAE